MLEQMEATEKRQWCCNTWKQGRWSRAATGGSSKATCSGAAIDKGSRVDPMVLQQVETVEDAVVLQHAVVLQQVEATYIRHNGDVVDGSNRADALVLQQVGAT